MSGTMDGFFTSSGGSGNWRVVSHDTGEINSGTGDVLTLSPTSNQRAVLWAMLEGVGINSGNYKIFVNGTEVVTGLQGVDNTATQYGDFGLLWASGPLVPIWGGKGDVVKINVATGFSFPVRYTWIIEEEV